MVKPQEHKHVPVEAKVVGVDPGIEPISAIVVGDKRDKLGRTLAVLAIGLLLLYFGASSYIQSSKNGRQLEQSEKNQAKLVDTLDAQTKLILQLQDAVRRQNQALRDAGIQPVPVPGVKPTPPSSNGNGTTRPGKTQSSGPLPGPAPQPSYSAPPNPSPKPKPKPRPKPTPKPSPSPSPLVPAGEVVCRLTGICF